MGPMGGGKTAAEGVAVVVAGGTKEAGEEGGVMVGVTGSGPAARASWWRPWF